MCVWFVRWSFSKRLAEIRTDEQEAPLPIAENADQLLTDIRSPSDPGCHSSAFHAVNRVALTGLQSHDCFEADDESYIHSIAALLRDQVVPFYQKTNITYPEQ